MTKYCLTGTTGGLGSRVLHHLLHTLNISPQEIIISLYNPSKAPGDAKDLGIEVRKGDFTSPESLKESFKGADRLLLVSYPSMQHKIRVDAHINAINAARDVGIKHIYYTSLAFADDSKALVKQAHLDTEAYLRKISSESDLTYTSIKEGIYSESFPLYLNFSNFSAKPNERKAILPLNPSHGVSWVTRDDLGEATARLMLADPSSPQWKNKIVLLSGPEPWTFDQLAASITKLLDWTDHPLTVEGIGEDAWVSHQAEVKTGSKDDPEAREFARGWATTYPAIERGELAVVDPLCESLLGRKCVGMEESLRAILTGKGSENMDRYAR